MARVCQKWFINKSNPDKSGFFMEDVLKANIDLLLMNAKKKDDWDFVGVISGGGRVRVGKSVLAFQIAVYWIYQLEQLYGLKIPFTIKDNIIFHGSRLITQGNELGVKFPQSPLIFDEAGADLESTKVMKATTKAVKDFLRECGQYNMLILLVIPDFFDLPKTIALSRSDFLIDVFVLADKSGKLERGFFNFYNRDNKKKLYIYGKKELNYKAHPYNFHGRFYNFYPFDEQEYRKVKQEALKTREIEGKKQEKGYRQATTLMVIMRKKGYKEQQISDLLKEQGIDITQQAISDRICKFLDESNSVRQPF